MFDGDFLELLNTRTSVETQLISEYNISKRSFFYASRLFSQNISNGTKYREIPMVIAINILDFNLFSHDECHQVFRLSNDRNDDLFYDVIEIHFLELKKVNRDMSLNKNLMDWLSFLSSNNPEEIHTLAEGNDEIMTAAKELDRLNNERDVRMEAEAIEKYERDKISRESNILERGLMQGAVRERTRIVRKLLSLNYTVAEIADFLDESTDYVKTFIKEHLKTEK
ncbi:Rpn family recombination-promoting nuclease/putative transposase [Acidaminobacter sp. JC074]|uniref:Rpn family recombination-promoting nuclease/putative transposase n=1 Tax=Acidaminobacter sp. JC074 TaxID=2530199 RepID=UPI002ED207F7